MKNHLNTLTKKKIKDSFKLILNNFKASIMIITDESNKCDKNFYNLQKENFNLSKEDKKLIIKIIEMDLKLDENLELTKKILSLNVLENTMYNSKISILQYAILNNFDNFIIHYLSTNLNKLDTDFNGRNLLHYLAAKNKIDIILKLDKNILHQTNISDKYGNKPISIAIKNKSYEVIDFFLKNDYNLTQEEIEPIYLDIVNLGNIQLLNQIDPENKMINITNKNKETPLHISTKNHNYEMIYYLLKNGADITKESYFGTIFEYGIYDPKTLNLLLKNGIMVNELNKQKDHPIIHIIKSKNLDVQTKKKIINTLMKQQFSINLKNSHGNSLLHYSIIFDESPDLINFIKKLGCFDSFNDDGLISEDLKNNDTKILNYLKDYNNKYELNNEDDYFSDI